MYLTPKFATCTCQIYLPSWPPEKTDEEFLEVMTQAVSACIAGDVFNLR
jgi:hypothetical protein